VVADNWVVVSGQLPMIDGQLTITGHVGHEVSLEQARDAARVAAVNALAQLARVANGLDHVRQIVRVGAFVSSTSGFHDQAKVANAASELIAEAFGDAGRHARAAVGVNVLPLNSPVEIEMTALIQS
jgi:enamine deaminase RidA (YjgF/YER057c/UK114 family)